MSEAKERTDLIRWCYEAGGVSASKVAAMLGLDLEAWRALGWAQDVTEAMRLTLEVRRLEQRLSVSRESLDQILRLCETCPGREMRTHVSQ